MIDNQIQSGALHLVTPWGYRESIQAYEVPWFFKSSGQRDRFIVADMLVLIHTRKTGLWGYQIRPEPDWARGFATVTAVLENIERTRPRCYEELVRLLPGVRE